MAEANSTLIRDIREDQLRWLWRSTIVVAFAIFWLVTAFYTALTPEEVTAFVVAPGIIIAGSLLTGYISRREESYQLAIWVYLVTILIAVLVSMSILGDSPGTYVAPFLFPLLILLAGGMLSPYTAIGMFFVCAALTIFAPVVNKAIVIPVWATAGTIGLSLLSTLLVFLIAGQTYSIAEWALENYRISRKQTLELRANRAELEQTLRARNILNRQLREAREEAEEAKRRRGQFLADMSHELRTPLNAILGFSESMLYFPEAYDEMALPEAYKEDLSQIYTSGRQLLTVINDVLDLAKVDAGKLDLFAREIEVRPVVENCLDTLAGLVRNKPIELRMEIPDDLPDACADPSRVRQVLINLVGNAIKFTDEGHITVSAKEDGDFLVLRVADTGIGIDQEHQDKIFEEFIQVDDLERPFNPGAGLGLTISRRLVEMMGGKIWVQSEPGQGSTFSFTIPRAVA